MDKHGIFADGASWEEARKKALDARPASLEDALEWIRGQM